MVVIVTVNLRFLVVLTIKINGFPKTKSHMPKLHPIFA